MSMSRSEIIGKLHAMVDQLETVPEEWFASGIYPLHKVTYVSKDDSDERLTLIVGVSDRDGEP